MVYPQYNTTSRNGSGVDFVGYMGSGYGDNDNEGKTIFTFDVLTGDMVASPTVPEGDQTYVPQNALVANMVAYNPQQVTGDKI